MILKPRLVLLALLISFILVILVEGQKLPEILVILVMIPLMDMELVVSTVITLNVYHVILVTFYFLQRNVNPANKLPV